MRVLNWSMPLLQQRSLKLLLKKRVFALKKGQKTFAILSFVVGWNRRDVIWMSWLSKSVSTLARTKVAYLISCSMGWTSWKEHESAAILIGSLGTIYRKRNHNLSGINRSLNGDACWESCSSKELNSIAKTEQSSAWSTSHSSEERSSHCLLSTRDVRVRCKLREWAIVAINTQNCSIELIPSMVWKLNPFHLRICNISFPVYHLRRKNNRRVAEWFEENELLFDAAETARHNRFQQSDKFKDALEISKHLMATLEKNELKAEMTCFYQADGRKAYGHFELALNLNKRPRFRFF